MTYHQLTSGDRYTISALKLEGFNCSQIARHIGRHRSTVCRELSRNHCKFNPGYTPQRAHDRAMARKRACRRNKRFDATDFAKVEELVREDWSPEQISGILARTRVLNISHETIYKYVWENRRQNGDLYTHLRCATKKRRKRYGRYDSRGRLADKRNISERPATVETRRFIGHWEIDTVMGKGDKHCIVTMVERKTGYLVIGKLLCRTTEELNKRVIQLITQHLTKFKSITADNGTEFHGYKKIEEETGVPFYFANPHHSWERGTNENTNGLIRQYLPKGQSMTHITQQDCNAIARKLNTRPRKRLGYKTPEECFYGL
jgi:IS30 family transposase